jgi:anti-sigma factor RsiW
MITCRELVELLIDFVSDELPPEHRARVEHHLNGCPCCVTYVETYRLTIRLTRQLPCAPLPGPLRQRLEAALNQICQELRREKGKDGEGVTT